MAILDEIRNGPWTRLFHARIQGGSIYAYRSVLEPSLGYAADRRSAAHLRDLGGSGCGLGARDRRMTGYSAWTVVIVLALFLGSGALLTAVGAWLTARDIDRDPTA
jgi:hypothetical protein